MRNTQERIRRNSHQAFCKQTVFKALKYNSELSKLGKMFYLTCGFQGFLNRFFSEFVLVAAVELKI